MNKIKTGNIEKTIENTIYLLNEKINKIKQIDNKKFEEMQEKLNQVILGVRKHSLSAFEIVDLLMRLQNETIIFLDANLYKESSNEPNIVYNNNEEATAIQLYVSPKKGFWEKIGEKFLGIKKVASNLGLDKASLENTNTINQIAEKVSQNYMQTDKQEYTEDFRKPVYDFFKEIKEHKRISQR